VRSGSRIPARDLVEAVVHQRVTRDVHPDARRALDPTAVPTSVPAVDGTLERLHHAPHHGRQQRRERPWRVSSRHRRDREPAVAAPEPGAAPRPQADRSREPLPAQLRRGVRRRHDRDPPVEFARHAIVEVVTVVMRQDHHVDRRGLGERHGRLQQPLGAESPAEPCALARVQEVRIRQDAEAAHLDQRRGGADERHRVGRRRLVHPAMVPSIRTLRPPRGGA